MDEAGFENRVGDAFYTMRSNPGAFGSNSTLRMAYFWDMMDDRFPELFQAVQHQPDFGQAVTVAEYYFLFVRQVFNSDRERIGRLRAVVDWAERNGKHLIVQSDLTNGNVSGSGPEGYQAAANVMVIVNSQDDNRLGQGLEAAIVGPVPPPCGASARTERSRRRMKSPARRWNRSSRSAWSRPVRPGTVQHPGDPLRSAAGLRQPVPGVT